MYGSGSWIMKRKEICKIEAFELQCWRRLLRIPWMTFLTNASILEEVRPRMMLINKIRRQEVTYFGRVARASSLDKSIMMGMREGSRGRGDRECVVLMKLLK